MYNPKTKVALGLAIDAFVDFIIEWKKCERLEERGPTIETTGIDFTIKDLLIHTPLQYWRLPYINHCPCAFCDERLEPTRMEFHFAVQHVQPSLDKMFYSELHFETAGFLAVYMRVRKQTNWKCPFDLCPSEFQRYSQMSEHSMKDHPEDEKQLYSTVGGFCGPLLCLFHRSEKWPTVFEIFTANQDLVQIEVLPRGRERADALWRRADRRLSEQDIGNERIRSGPPLEPIPRQLRRDASARGICSANTIRAISIRR
jgi:hypothetical protein